MSLEIKVEDFPADKDIDWQWVAKTIGIENAMEFLDMYGGGDRKLILSAETVRRSARKRVSGVPHETAG
jgi:hypothetical protein